MVRILRRREDRRDLRIKRSCPRSRCRCGCARCSRWCRNSDQCPERGDGPLTCLPMTVPRGNGSSCSRFSSDHLKNNQAPDFSEARPIRRAVYIRPCHHHRFILCPRSPLSNRCSSRAEGSSALAVSAFSAVVARHRTRRDSMTPLGRAAALAGVG